MAKRGAEFEETLWRLKQDVELTEKILAVFFGMTVFLRLLGIPVPPAVFLGLLGWFFSHLFRKRLLKRAEKVEGLHNLYFFFNIIDFLFLTLITYFTGASDWLGSSFFLITLAMSGLLLPKEKVIYISIIAFFFYSSLLSLEYFEVIPYRSLFPTLGLLRAPFFTLSQLLTSGLLFYFTGEVTGSFSEMLRERTRALAKEREKVREALSQSQEMEKILKVRVRAKTRELRTLTEEQEETIDKRTEELKKRLEELEKFRKLTVGRELKMTELKKRNERLKQKLEELKSLHEKK